MTTYQQQQTLLLDRAHILMAEAGSEQGLKASGLLVAVLGGEVLLDDAAPGLLASLYRAYEDTARPALRLVMEALRLDPGFDVLDGGAA